MRRRRPPGVLLGRAQRMAAKATADGARRRRRHTGKNQASRLKPLSIGAPERSWLPCSAMKCITHLLARHCPSVEQRRQLGAARLAAVAAAEAHRAVGHRHPAAAHADDVAPQILLAQAVFESGTVRPVGHRRAATGRTRPSAPAARSSTDVVAPRPPEIFAVANAIARSGRSAIPVPIAMTREPEPDPVDQRVDRHRVGRRSAPTR